MNDTLCTGDVTLRSTRKVFYLQYPVQGLSQKKNRIPVSAVIGLELIGKF